MFLLVSVILSTGGSPAGRPPCRENHPPWQGDPPAGRPPLARRPPGRENPPGKEAPHPAGRPPGRENLPLVGRPPPQKGDNPAGSMIRHNSVHWSRFQRIEFGRSDHPKISFLLREVLSMLKDFGYNEYGCLACSMQAGPSVTGVIPATHECSLYGL